MSDFLCFDCRIDTSFAIGNGHCYSLRPALWRQATGADGTEIVLCLDCLETRLGRRLVAADFRITPPEMIERMAWAAGLLDGRPKRPAPPVRERLLRRWRHRLRSP